MPDTLPELLRHQNIRYDAKFYIKDLNGKWVDFSDKTDSYGTNRLKAVGTITNKVEVDLGSFVTTIQSIRLDNRDGFFNEPFPKSLLTVDSSAVSFGLSIGYKKPILRGRECKVAVQIKLPANTLLVSGTYASPRDVVQEETLGHFYIEEMTPDIAKSEMKLKIISQDGRMQKKEAASIKRGFNWYLYRSVSFLLEQILLSEYAEDGELPVAYNIDKTPYMSTLNNRLTTSNLGRPPLWDGSEWRDDGYYTRALCFADVDSTGEKLYLGCDNQLWSYTPTTGVYASIDTSTIPITENIRYIYYDSTGDQLIVLSWEDPYYGTYPDAKVRTGFDGEIYVWSGAGSLTAKTTALKLMPFDFMVRNGSYSSFFGIGYSITDPPEQHENMFIPFPQQVNLAGGYEGAGSFEGGTLYWGNVTNEVPLAYIPTGAGEKSYTWVVSSVSKGWFCYINRGFTWSYSTIASSSSEASLLYRVGQTPCVLISDYTDGSNNRYVYTFKMVVDGVSGRTYPFDKATYNDAGVYHCEIAINEYVGGAQVEKTYQLGANGTKMYPLLLIKNGVSDIAWMFTIRLDTGTNNPDVPFECYFGVLDLTNTIFSSDPIVNSDFKEVCSGETGDDEYWTPIAGECPYANDADIADSNDYIVLSMFNRKTGVYALITMNTWDMEDNYGYIYSHIDTDILRFSSTPFVGFTRSEKEDTVVYCYNISEGKIFKITTGASPTIEIISDTSVVPNESGLLAGLAINHNHTTGAPELYGVTSPNMQLECNASYQQGKYVLFRVHNSVSDIIEYAYFEGMKKWKAINELAQSRDGIAFFDRNGNFNYKPRIYTSSSADWTIGAFEDGTTNSIISVGLDYGYKKVFNVVKVQTYISQFTGPNPDVLSLITRNEANSDNVNTNNLDFVPYSMEQKDFEKKKLLVYCVHPGNPATGLSKWKYSVVRYEVEAILNGDHISSATQIDVQSVFGGGTYGSASNEEGIIIGDFASVVDEDTGEVITRSITDVTIDPAHFHIATAFGIALKDNAIITISKAYQIDTSYNRAEWSDDGVGYVDSATSTTFTMPDTLPQPLGIGHIVKFSNDYHEYRITAFDKIDTYTIVGIDTGTAAWNIQPTNGDTIYAYWSPNRSYSGEIGNTNIFVEFETGTGTAETDYTEEFVPGDRIIVDCPGETLEPEAGSLQIAVAGNSIDSYGRNEYSIDNRFVGKSVAQEMSRRIIYYYKDPKYILDITIPLAPYIDLVNSSGELAIIDVILPSVFSNSNDYTESFLIGSIAHDLKNFQTKLKLYGIDAY